MPVKSTGFPKDRPPKPHVIDDISFAEDFIVCTCAWKGKVADFVPHRKEAIAKMKEAS